MATLEQQAKGGSKGEIRYLTPLEIDTKVKVKYCRFKKNGIKKWAIFLEKFGSPHAIGKTPRNSETKERAELLDSLQNLIDSACATIPDDASVELLEMSSGNVSGDLYERHARYHDGEISKVILGHSAAADSTPGRLGGEDGAMAVRADIIDDDSAMVEDCFNELIRYIHELNPSLGHSRPCFELYDEEEVDTERADRDFKLMNSGHVIPKKKYFVRRYDFDEDEIDVIETPDPSTPQKPSKPTDPAEFSAPPSGQDDVDEMLDSIKDSDLNNIAAEFMQPVFELLDTVNSYDELNSRLVELYPKMPTDKLSTMLEKAMLLSSVRGNQKDEVTR